MFRSLSFAAMLYTMVLPAVLSATITDIPGRALVGARTLDVDGHNINVAIVPIASSSPLNELRSKVTTRSTSWTSLGKRVVTNNACFEGCPAETCTDGLNTLPDPPLAADCTALAAAVQALAQSELTTTFPCDIFNPGCPNFSVPPGFEQQYSLGTCLTGFANLNPTGGPTLEFCNYLIAGTFPSIYTACVTNATLTGGFCSTNDPGNFYAIEVRHV